MIHCLLPPWHLPAVRRDSERFPEMQRWRGEVAAAEKALADLLPSYRRQLQISSLQVRAAVQNAWFEIMRNN